MLELTTNQEMTPDLLLAELATARRVSNNLTSLEDIRAVQRYIVELEDALTCMEWPARRMAVGR